MRIARLRPARSGHAWVHRYWLLASLSGAVLITLFDAALLQRSRSYFTGGFLSVDHLATWQNVAMFLVTSLTVDTAFIGLVAAAAAWALTRARLSAAACVCGGALAATTLLVAVDVLSYEVLRYLGDAFDFALMFDLTGRSLSEILAVTSGHLAAFGAFVVVAAGAVAAVIWAVNRYWASGPPGRFGIRTLMVPTAVALFGAVTLSAAVNTSDVLENGLLRKPSGRAFAMLLNAATDVDRDGFGIVGRRTDPDPFDGAVFPYAADIPGNGVDEDGVAGDLPIDAAVLEPDPGHASGWQRRPDVVLFVLESFRADIVGAQLNGKPVTPAIDAIAARGVSLQAAFSHNGYTVQSRHHLFTGSLVAARAATTLVDDFLANGYHVGYVSAQDESFGGAAYDVGFARATFATDSRADRARRYSQSTTPGSLFIPATVVQERIGQFLDMYAADAAPLFLHVNFQETHFPYSHPGVETVISPVRIERGRIGPGRRDELWATYANTAAYVDRMIGQVLDAVRRARGTDPAVVITSDHGESLYDEGFLGHGYALNDVQTRVPLVVANLPIELEDTFGQVDLRAALGAALQKPLDVPAIPSVRHAADRPVFQYLGDLSRPAQIAFLRRDGRLIYDFRTRRVQLPGGAWSTIEALTGAHHQAATRLVYHWEALNLQRLTGL